MEPLFEILRGPYAYLLIAQIVIVALLCLTMVWLIFQRLRESPETEAPLQIPVPTAIPEIALPAATAAAKAPPPPDTPSAGLERTTEPQSEPRVDAPLTIPQPAPEPEAGPEPMATPEASAGEEFPAATVARDNNQETATLKDQVRYLESKLLEYEIVQEEISTLSSLKTQNEELKQQIARLEEQNRSQTPTTPGEPSAPSGSSMIPPETGPHRATG